MKKNMFFLDVLVMIALISGCGMKESTEHSNTQIPVTDLQQEIMQEDEKKETIEANEVQTELNYNRADIKYEGNFPVKLILSCGENMIFMIGRTEEGRSLYKMESEESCFEKLDIVIPDDLGAKNMVVDDVGNCHILMMSVKDNRLSYETMQMWIVAPDGTLVEKIDFSDEVKSLNPFCLAFDNEGYYYLDSLGQNIYKVDGQGKLCSTVELQSIEGIGIGDENNIYITTTNQEGNGSNLYCLNGNELERIEKAELPLSMAKYSDLYSGQKSEVVIFSETAGVLAYDSETKLLKHLLTQNDFPCSAQDMIGYGMLVDGRFVCVYEENGVTYFSYIPLYGDEN